MPALSFSSRFAALVEKGEKTQTIRAARKRPIRVGDRLYLYTGMRTKACRKLGDGVVTHVERCVIDCDPQPSFRFEWESLGASLTWSGDIIGAIAKLDGFESPDEMIEWFRKTHGLPFHGHLIRWRIEGGRS